MLVVLTMLGATVRKNFHLFHFTHQLDLFLLRIPWKSFNSLSTHLIRRRRTCSFQTSSSSRCLSTMITPANSTPRRDFFSYTSGRYLYNENLRFAERYVEFNVEALESIAARSVGRKNVAHIRKLAEGGFNRVFLLTMEDGFEVLAKIPYPLTAPKTLTTESEVATLDFLHSRGIPVPRVYTYSSKSDNPVGTEYIIMQKAPGRLLEERWFDLTAQERVRFVTSYVEIERKLFSIPFGSYGSLYYRDSLPSYARADLYAPPHRAYEGDDANRFCIGPSAEYMFWRGKRALFEVDRGPWKDPRDYVRSVGQRELEWTRKFGKPQQNDFPHNNILKGDISPTGYIDLLEQYISLSPYILPRDRGNFLNKPTLRHPDLNPSNVFISDSCEVSCIVDWQHSSILPLLLTAGNPPLFENPDSEPPKGIEKPSLPEDYASLSPEEKSHANELHRRRMLFYLYMVFNGRDNKAHLDALRYPLLTLRQHAVDRAGRQWSGNIVTLKGALLRLAAHWDQLVDGNQEQIQCPVHFDPKEAEEFFLIEDNWFKATILLEYWRSILDDLGQDGWVRRGSYEDVVEKNHQLKKEWLAEAEDEDDFISVDRFWPFQDHEELD